MKNKKPDYSDVKNRTPALTALRNLKMAVSAHAYVRGNTVNFYDWLETTNGRKVPQGPAIWICGDCHVGNLGPIANAKGRIDVQIRDLDQTVIGNPAHDLIRLGLSLVTAARGSDLPGITTARMIEQMMQGYEQAFSGDHEKEDETQWPEAVQLVMKQALRRTWKHLARERIEDTDPTIPLGKRFWPLSKKEREQVYALFDDEKLRHLVTSLHSRDDGAPIKVVGAAYWMKGCSSLGLLRYAVLVRVGGKKKEYCLMDIKEAAAPAAPCYKGHTMPRDNAMRVLEGAMHLSPALGNRMVATKLSNHSVFVRELLPQDMKFDIEHLTSEEAVKVAWYLASVVGKAHARQMDKATRKEWQATLARNHTKTLDAPSWLWASIIELMMTHEAAYLEHCRRYAVEEKT